MEYDPKIADKICNTLVKAGSAFSPDKKEAYENAARVETNPQARWVLETILKTRKRRRNMAVPSATIPESHTCW